MYNICYNSDINLSKATQMFQPTNNLQISGTLENQQLFQVNKCYQVGSQSCA
jgi:hypothetical protein